MRKNIAIGALVMWVVSIVYVPISIATQLEGWAPFHRVVNLVTGVLSLMWWFEHRGIDFRMGFRIGYKRGSKARDEHR